MEGENRGFIVNYYTTGNGTKLTRHEVAERILKMLEGGGLTCGNLARNLKLNKQAIYNVTAYMLQNKSIGKYKNDKGIYEYRKVQDCLLAQLFYPSPEEVEKRFKIKGRTVRKVDQGTTKSHGYKHNNIHYNGSYYDSIDWE